MAAAMVLRDALRLYLSAGAALWRGAAGGGRGFRAGVSPFYGAAVLLWPCRCLFSGACDERVARRGVAGGRGIGVGLSGVSLDSPGPLDVGVPYSVAAVGSAAVRR